jgi:archaemetzincin
MTKKHEMWKLELIILIMAFLMLASFCEDDPPPGNRETNAGEQPEFFLADDSDFEILPPPGPGDWRYVFKEPDQSFDMYVKSRPVRAEGERRVLVFQPVGTFSGKERRIFEKAVELAGIWFDLPARVEPELPLPEKGWQRVNQFPWQKRPMVQYRTGYFLDRLLPERLPQDAACYLAVTMADLYPDDSWNYVFGQATFRKRVGVYSFVRYFPEFWGEPQTKKSDLLALRRSCKVLVHEAGHMFGMAHCQKYKCVMNGSNSLEEADGRPLRLCPECLKKLRHNRGFDLTERCQKMERFFRDNGLTDDADWMAGRLQKIKKRK